MNKPLQFLSGTTSTKILLYLVTNGFHHPSQREIAKSIDVTYFSISTNINKLDELGLVITTGKGRSPQITLTKKGRGIAYKLLAIDNHHD